MAQNLIRLKQLEQSELSGFVSQAVANTGIISSVINSIGSGLFISVSGDQRASGVKTFLNNINISGDLTVNGTIRANEILDFTITGDISGYTGQFQALYVKGQAVVTGSAATASSLFQTGENLYNYINGLSGTLNNSGSVLYTYITQLSGDFDTSGSVLNSYINNLSGNSVLLYGNQTITGTKTFINNQIFSGNILVSGTGIFNSVDLNNIDNLSLSGVDITITSGTVILTNPISAPNLVYVTGNQNVSGVKNFQSQLFVSGIYNSGVRLANLNDLTLTGASLHDSIRELSGIVTSLSGDFNQTGYLLNNYINNLSGLSVLRYSDQLISGNKTFFGTTTFSGQSINLIDTALNLSGIGDMTFTGVNINFINSPVYISGTNLRVVGDVLANNLVYTSGNQNISGIKNFTNNLFVSGIYNSGVRLANLNDLTSSGASLNNAINTLSGNAVLVYGDQLVSGVKIFGSGNSTNPIGLDFPTIAGGVGNRISGDYNVIAGGERNIITGHYGLIGGGCCNFLSGGFNSIIAGGLCNTNNSNYATIVGGATNRINLLAGCSSIGGGSNNLINVGTWSVIGGGSFNCITGGDSNVILGGARNIAAFPYSVVVGGNTNNTCSSYGLIGGGCLNAIQDSLGCFGTIVNGQLNLTSGCYSFIGGGGKNLLGFPYSVIVGGCVNQSHAAHSFVGGGFLNTIRGFGGASILGGSFNTVTGDHAVVLGGARSEAGLPYSAVVGGCCHLARGCMSFIGGGDRNSVLADYGYVVGGRCATVSLFHSGAAVLGDGQNRNHFSSGAHTLTLDFASGIYLADPDFFGNANFNHLLTARTGLFGLNSRISGNASALLGGINNFTSGYASLIGGGDGNCSIGSTSIIGAGTLNCIFTDYSAILGGEGNMITDCYSTIVGGFQNCALGQGGFVGGGELNCVSGTASSVVGGSDNEVTGTYSFIGGGFDNSVRAPCAYIVGGRCAIIQAGHGGAAVLGDGENRQHLSSGSNTLTLDFNSGVYFARPNIFGNLRFSNSTIDLGNSRLVNAIPEFINETTNFVISGNDNGRIILANSATRITGMIVSGNPTGFNTSIIQIGAGQIFISGSGLNASIPVLSYNNQYRTAGAGATISILNTGNNRYIMYGNTI
jgi:hypothetical protein